MLIYRVPSLVLLACALGVCSAPVEADVISIADTSVSLSLTGIAFSSLSGPSSVTLGAASTGAFAGLGGSPATLQNISAGSLPIANFLSIPTLPNAHFTLISVGPGTANTNCAFSSCSPFAGSPLVLTRTIDGTVVSFSASGTVADNSGATRPFTAVFSTEISGQTPIAVQTLLPSGTLRAPFSAALQVTAGPFAGSLDIGVPTLSLASTAVGFTPPAMTLGPTSTGLFASLSGSSLSLQNFNAGSGNVNNFLSLAALPNVDFTLTFVGPGSANTNCAVLSVGGSCSPFAGSPFVLLDLPTGVVVSFTAGGTAFDALTSLQTTFEGTFVTELAGGVSPFDVAALLNGGGINASFSAELTAGPFASRPLPEPATLVLLTVAIVGALVSRARPPTRRG